MFNDRTNEIYSEFLRIGYSESQAAELTVLAIREDQDSTFPANASEAFSRLTKILKEFSEENK